MQRRQTSIYLEPPFLLSLQEIAKSQRRSINRVVQEIDEHPRNIGLNAAIRVYILEWYREKARQRRPSVNTPHKVVPPSD